MIDISSLKAGDRITFRRDRGEKATVVARPGPAPWADASKHYEAAYLSIEAWVARGWRIVRVRRG